MTVSLSFSPTDRVLLLRQGLVFPTGTGPRHDEGELRLLDLELAGLGYAMSARLRDRLATMPLDALLIYRRHLWRALAEHLGHDQTHTPLFRHFPDDTPRDTENLWLKRVLSHFLQGEEQPCLSCREVGTTHVLKPCRHVVCDRCFDGAHYGGCPICGRHADPSSPFFQPEDPAMRISSDEVPPFKLLDLGGDRDAAAEALMRSFCARRQPMAPADRADLEAIVADYRERALAWLPEVVPVRETAALVLGGLSRAGVLVPDDVLAHHMRSATDVLRFLAAASGADVGLQGEKVWKAVGDMQMQLTQKRFRMIRLPRVWRRRLLALLERLDEETLTEEMRRQRSYWVWAGEFLHPHEYASRFPKAARAFAVVRRKAPDGERAPAFHGRSGRVETALNERDLDTLLPLLTDHPGELARRLDHLLRLTEGDPAGTERVVGALSARLGALATPMLMTLLAHLPSRGTPAPVRVYWPKGVVARGVWAPDQRAPIAQATLARVTTAIEGELLRRFAVRPAVDDAVIDLALRGVVVPFNERTAARSAVALPRGSRVAIPDGKRVRMFLHWCQPEGPEHRTDLDLSVAFFDAAWQPVGVCSYYQLQFPPAPHHPAAVSSGDFTDAPPPEGATEFVDLDRELARAQGVRYAVMLVNAYAGLPFDKLERAFAGLMLRDDEPGALFDPRRVALRFALTGTNGAFMPLVFDLDEGEMHWLDVHTKGEFRYNNAATSSRGVSTICPTLMAYFASGVRPTMADLALLHAAARAERVYLRGETTRCLERNGDAPRAFLERLREALHGAAGASPDRVPGEGGRSVLAALMTGDMALPEAGEHYCLFPGLFAGNVAASDWLS